MSEVKKQFILHNCLKAQPGKGNELVDILLQASEVLKTVKGCRLYAISREENIADTVWITEVWNCKNCHAGSLENEEVRALIGKAMPLIAEPPQKGKELFAEGGLNIPLQFPV